MLLRLSAETLHDRDEVGRRGVVDVTADRLLQEVVSSGASRLAEVQRGTDTVLSRLVRGNPSYWQII